MMVKSPLESPQAATPGGRSRAEDVGVGRPYQFVGEARLGADPVDRLVEGAGQGAKAGLGHLGMGPVLDTVCVVVVVVVPVLESPVRSTITQAMRPAAAAMATTAPILSLGLPLAGADDASDLRGSVFVFVHNIDPLSLVSSEAARLGAPIARDHVLASSRRSSTTRPSRPEQTAPVTGTAAPIRLRQPVTDSTQSRL